MTRRHAPPRTCTCTAGAVRAANTSFLVPLSNAPQQRSNNSLFFLLLLLLPLLVSSNMPISPLLARQPLRAAFVASPVAERKPFSSTSTITGTITSSISSTSIFNNDDNDQTEQQLPEPIQKETTEQEQHLVLIGGGHAHVQVIKTLRQRPAHLRVTLIDCQRAASYSGMIPGCLAGLYTPEQTQLALPPLARYANLSFVHARVVDLDLERKLVYVSSSSTPIPFDAISLDIGSTSRGWDTTPGAAQYTIPTRPIHRLVQRLQDALEQQKKQQQQQQQQKPVQFVVVGGGVAGLELALSITARWRRALLLDQGAAGSTTATPTMECTILHRGPELVPEESPAVRATLQQILRDPYQIRVVYNCHVTQVHADAIEWIEPHASSSSSSSDHDDNPQYRRLPYTHCVWATGAGSHELARHLAKVRGLDCDADGWVNVQSTLQSTRHPFVFAAGDCATLQGLSSPTPLPKAGVYAVRAGPVLLENLLRYLESVRGPPSTANRIMEKQGEKPSLVVYAPQTDFLKLITCGDGTALGMRFGLALRGKWVFDLKNDIDQSFMKLFHVSTLLQDEHDIEDDPQSSSSSSSSSSPVGQYNTRQYDDEDNNTKDSFSRHLPSPIEAATLLLRTDDHVDFQLAKRVLRAMGQDPIYRQAVLEEHRQLSVLIETPNADPMLLAEKL